MNAPLTTPGDLLATRLLLLRDLAHSLEGSQIALTGNDAEMIARGAAHQAELCRQWSLLEDELQRQSALPRSRETGSPAASSAMQHEREFEALTARIRHLTRVHCSLLRHLQRSLTIMACVVDRCSPTYTPNLSLLRADARPQAGG
jgi:tRNA-dihydrouridine synthase